MKLSYWRITGLVLVLFSFKFAQEQQVEISDFYAKVYLAPTTSSRFIGLAQKGETYTVVETRDAWLRIRFKNAVGWIQQAQTQKPGTQAASAQSGAADSSSQTAAVQSTTDSSPVSSVAGDTPKPTTPEIALKTERAASTQKSSDSQAPKLSSKPEKTEDEKPKRDLRLRNWFSQQNFLNNLPPNQDIDDQDVKYFQVTFGPARVLLYLNPDSPILGMAKKGDVFPIVGEGDSWCKVVYADTVGWIERRNGKIIDAPKSLLANDIMFFGAVLLILGLIVTLLLVFLSIIRKKRNIKAEDISIKKNVLIIAKTNKTIQYTLTDTTTTLERCFAEIGFDISIAKEPTSIRNFIQSKVFDLLIIDWKFERNIVAYTERLFSAIPNAKNILCIVYNTPDPSAMRSGKIFMSTVFLGSNFSDRDIFKLVTPLIQSENSKNVQKNMQSSALQGNIADGNLLEVLQFIEIGSKTGCLLIETDRPFGLIYFQNGRIVYAATAQEITGKDAVFMILNLKQGNFRFVLNRKPKSSNANLSTLQVLMEWAKALDEANGH
jgi:SH3-like domain-containing protein